MFNKFVLRHGTVSLNCTIMLSESYYWRVQCIFYGKGQVIIHHVYTAGNLLENLQAP